MTAQKSPQLPLGADPDPKDAVWEDNLDGRRYRLVWSHRMPLPEGIDDIDIRAVVTMFEDGSIGLRGEDQPEINIGDSVYSITGALEVIHAITAAVNQAVQWIGVNQGQ